MKNENIVLVGLLILVIGGLAYAATGFSRNQAPTATETGTAAETSSSFQSIPSGSTGIGDVSVVLTPKSMVGGRLEVEIAVNTHSVSLSQFDLQELTRLEYNGHTVKPSSAPGLGGHHSSGILAFDIGDDIGKFRIVIKGIPKVEERVFEWG